ncbi:hypothetical protein DSL72_008890 [Monilinia vaccinii-corymbosi]|uniref:HTH araC/xylS-type domain-containing protein n=1 Tax=Monilinia vaccinii-corymbosi TaxID=61207 RepID=A0A8A3PSI6_9HELO|nr:hypothetical protein DSL72_008890 [Monilinia vaccinii-corymbosi]
MSNKRLFLTSSQRHQALVSRDPLAHSSFIYSVITTRIYCRPTCPSRLARRANIIFHENAEEAERDGFRACRRCRPGVDGHGGRVENQGAGGGKGDHEENPAGNSGDPSALDDMGEMGRGKRMADKAMDLIEREVENDGGRWTVKKLAREVGLTESHFCRVFKKETGMTMGEYRMKVVGKKQGEVPESNAILMVGDAALESEGLSDWDLFWENTAQMDILDADLSFPDPDTTILSDSNEYDGMEFLDLECYENR